MYQHVLACFLLLSCDMSLIFCEDNPEVEIILECAKSNGITDHSKMMELFMNPNQKFFCFVACVMDKHGLIVEGSLQIDNETIAKVDKYINGEKIAKIVNESFQKCHEELKGKSFPSNCELAEKYVTCILGEAKKNKDFML